MDAQDLSDELREVLALSQRLGFLGDRPIDEVIAHARSFLPPLAERPGPLLDLGSGGGVPGLVIAHDRPDLAVTLLDRRRTRTDFLARMVARLGWSSRVSVWPRDATDRVEPRFDAVVARGFGPPIDTLRIAASWLTPTGVVVISEPPSGDRWAGVDLGRIGVERRPSERTIAVFARSTTP